MQDSPWLRDFVVLHAPPKLDRQAFAQKYLPGIAGDYTPRHGILTVGGGGKPFRVVNTGSGATGVRTKRARRIDEAFARYVAAYDDCLARNHWVPSENA